MKAQSLACSASSSRTAAGPARARAAAATVAARRRARRRRCRRPPGPTRSRGRRRAPQVLACSVATSARRATRRGLEALERVVEAHELEPLARRTPRRPPRSQCDALVPPVPEQLGVERADDEPAARAGPPPSRAQPLARARDEVGGVLARASASAALVVVGARRRCPTGCGGGRCGGGSRGRRRRRGSRRRSTRARSWRGRSARSTHARVGDERAQVLARAEPEAVGQLDAGARARRRRSSGGSSHGAWAHSGSQKPPRQPSPKRARCESIPRLHLQRARRRRSRAAAARRASPRRSTARAARARRAGRLRARRMRCERRARSRAQARSSSRASCVVPAGAQPGGVLACVRRRTSSTNAAKRSATPGASSWSHSTGVSDSVSGAPRVEQVEQRQVAAGDRLPQPLLAERPGAEALDVGHVRVQDDRERAARARRRAQRSRPADRDEVERAVAGRPRRRRAARSPTRAIAGVKRS